MVCITSEKDSDNPTSIVTASMRSAVGVEVLKVDLRPREEVSAHWEAEDRGLPRTSRLRMVKMVKSRWRQNEAGGQE